MFSRYVKLHKRFLFHPTAIDEKGHSLDILLKHLIPLSHRYSRRQSSLRGGWHSQSIKTLVTFIDSWQIQPSTSNSNISLSDRFYLPFEYFCFYLEGVWETSRCSHGCKRNIYNSSFLLGRNPANSVLYLHQLFVCPRPAPRHSICSACNPNYSWPSVPSAVSTQSVHSSVDLILYFDYSHVTDYFSINPKLQP